MRGAIRSIAGVCVTTLLVVACGGSKPEAKEPEAEAASGSEARDTAKKPPSGGDADGEKADKADDAADDAKPAKATASDGKKPLRSAKDIITREDVLFMFSFPASEPHQVAEKKCGEKSGDDPKKKADCMSKVSRQFESDGMAFTQDAEGKFFWLTVRRKGNGLTTLHKVEIDFDGDGESQVTIKPHGKDVGTKPGGLPKELVIEVPSENEIAVKDPKHGRLVYEAKVGMLGKNDR